MDEVIVAGEAGVRCQGRDCRRCPDASHGLVTSPRRSRPRRRSAGWMFGLEVEAGRPESVVAEDLRPAGRHGLIVTPRVGNIYPR